MTEGVRTNPSHRGTQRVRIHPGWFRAGAKLLSPFRDLQTAPMPEPELEMSAAEWIQSEIDRRGWAKRDVDRMTGMSLNTTSMITTYHTLCSAPAARRYAILFGVDPEWAEKLPGVSKRKAA